MIHRLFGFVLIVLLLSVVYIFESSSMGSGLWRILHWPAIVLTLFGPLGPLLFMADISLIRDTFKFLRLSPSQLIDQQAEDLKQLTSAGEEYYRQGRKALQNANFHSPLLQKLQERFLLNLSPSDLLTMMSIERERENLILNRCHKWLGQGVRLSPSIGMLGTIMGMSQLLNTLSDPSHIGPHMSLALLTTFYGLFFSLMVWTPLQSRLQQLMLIKDQFHQQLIDWVSTIGERRPIHLFADVHLSSLNQVNNHASSSKNQPSTH